MKKVFQKLEILNVFIFTSGVALSIAILIYIINL
jgi:hypothetical protein